MFQQNKIFAFISTILTAASMLFNNYPSAVYFALTVIIFAMPDNKK